MFVHFYSEDITAELNSGNELHRSSRIAKNVAASMAPSQCALCRTATVSGVLLLPRVVESEVGGERKRFTGNGNIGGT